MEPSRLAAFLHALHNMSVFASLAVLNDGVPHRYTALFHLREGMMVCLFMYDKQRALHTDLLQPVPLSVSFCQFALRDGVFNTENSRLDPRLRGHPYQGVVQSYHAVPLIGESDDLLGTLCHFDMVANVMPEGEMDLLRRAGRVLPGVVWPAFAA